MTRLDDHGKDLSDFVLLMRIEIPQDVWVELEYYEVVAANES